jgi:hypothetical protein
MDIESLVFLDFYGGPAKLTVEEYLVALPQRGEGTDTVCGTSHMSSFSKDDDGDDSDDAEKFKTILA